jgi:hypothetical protein
MWHHAAMKRAVLYLPIVLSFALLGAHFMRYGNFFGVAGAALLIALLFVRKPWVAWLMQIVLVLGTLEWLHTLYKLAQVRMALDQPYLRMVIILGVVALVALCSALLFRTGTLRRIYGTKGLE